MCALDEEGGIIQFDEFDEVPTWKRCKWYEVDRGELFEIMEVSLKVIFPLVKHLVGS